LLLLLIAPAFASAWWNGDWAYRKTITLDGAMAPDVGAVVQQLPVPVRLHIGNFSFLDAQTEGADLRFVGPDDKTPLSFHIEQYDPTNGIAIAWVQAPSVGAKDSRIHLYYGSAKAPPASNAKATFDPHTVAVLHLGERDGLPRDATGYGNHATSSSGTLRATGAIGFGLRLAKDQSIRMAAAPSLSTLPATGWTVALWVKVEDTAATGSLLTRTDAGKKLVLGLDEGRPYLALGSGGRRTVIAGSTPIDGGTWHQLAVTLSDRAIVYVDGREVASGAVQLSEFKGDIEIGASANGGPGIAGEIDEIQISNTARSAEWLRATAISQDPQSKLAVYGEDESGGGGDYLAILRTLFSAVSFDGWVVIGLIGALGFISAEVMFGKLLVLGRVRRQNEDFLKSFREPSSPLAKLKPAADEAAESHWRDSPLFHLFKRCLSEFHSVSDATGGELTPQALEVVRAGLDATIVEESHRLNNRLVLLTLSVSGAPFLGLLGTVVGIMITFASIAMAGDVNVNTIAPGVAAALTATVAGLAVAIPVLFGYNYLASRIRELTTTMEVFANELLGKLALTSSAARSGRSAQIAAAA
jgi:biopolymer transport protein ExbB